MRPCLRVRPWPFLVEPAFADPGIRRGVSVNFLITGGAGFLGAHLTARLLARGDSVVVVDDLSTGSVKNIEPFLKHEHFKFVYGSVLHKDVLAMPVDWSDCVLHMAAAVGVRLVVDRPVHTLETNVHGTENVLA